MASGKKRFGLSCALTTPISGGRPDLARLVHHSRRMLAEGCDTVTLFGTTGEGYAFGTGTRERMLGALLGAGIEPSKIYAGVSATAFEDAVAQARLALDAGVSGLLLAPPFYFKNVGDDGLFAWFSDFIEATAPAVRGILLYHIPGQTAVPISVDLVGRLKAAFPGVIAGVKDSSGDWANTEALLAAHSELSILVGDERFLARAVRKGAEGSICGLANLTPGLLRPVIYEGRDEPLIDDLVNTILRYPVLPAVKALVGHKYDDAAGFGEMLAPLEALTEAQRVSLTTQFFGLLKARAA